MLLLLAPIAYAHLPHDVVNAIAVPADLDPGVPWLMLGGSEGFQLLLRSDDGGRRWVYLAGQPLQDPLVGLTVVDDGTWVFAAADRVWSSTDDGVSWTSTDAPAPIGWITGGEAVVLGTTTGLWTGPAAGPYAQTSTRAIVDLQPGPLGTAAVDDAGHVWFRDDRAGIEPAGIDAAWTDAGSPPEPATAAAWGDTLYAGDRAGGVWSLDEGGWAACARLPPEALQLFPEVVRLATDGVTLLAVTGDRGPYLSTDQCRTWRDSGSPLVPLYAGSGSATDPHQAASALAISGERILQAGWAGLGVATDGAWYEPVIVPPDYTRGLAFSPDYTHDNALFIGGYAAGVARTADGGRTWEATNRGMSDPNVQRVVFPVHSHSAATLLAISGHHPWLSADGGDSWEALVAPFAYTAELWAWNNGATLWAGADPTASEGSATMRISDDFGATWTVDATLSQILRGSAPTSLTRFRRPDGTEVRVLGATDPSVVLVGPDQATWSAVFVDASATRLVGPVPYPEDDPVRIVFADSLGVHSSPDGVAWALYTGLGDDQAIALTAAGSHMFLATESNALWRSDDGGTTWFDLGVHVPAAVHCITAGPHFDDTPHLLIGTHDGVYTLDDPSSDTPAVVRFAPYQREDDASEYVVCTGCEAVDHETDAAMGTLTPLGDSGVMRATIRGQTIRILGITTSTGFAEVWVDGRLAATINNTSMPAPEVLSVIEGLPFAWHDVEVRARAQGIAIDAVEATGDGVWFADATSSPCGCRSNAAAAGLLLSAGWGATRRRRKK